MKPKNPKLSVLLPIGLFLIIASIVLSQDIITIIFMFTGAERVVALLTKVCAILGSICFIIGICYVLYVTRKNQLKNKESAQNNGGYEDFYYRKKNNNFTSNRATAEFIAAHKKEDGTYSIEYEYEKENGESFVEQYDDNYSYIDAKYFQKIRRFTVAYGENKSKIIDQPRPGIIPELAGMPVVSKAPIKEKEATKPLKEESELKSVYCAYCDCMFSKNNKSNKCPHCGAPIRK